MCIQLPELISHSIGSLARCVINDLLLFVTDQRICLMFMNLNHIFHVTDPKYLWPWTDA